MARRMHGLLIAAALASVALAGAADAVTGGYSTIGLLVSILLIAGVNRIGIPGMRSVGRPEGVDLAGRFAHTLVPGALAIRGPRWRRGRSAGSSP